jgi:hypothetical protein
MSDFEWISSMLLSFGRKRGDMYPTSSRLSWRLPSYSYNTFTIKTQSHRDDKNAWHLPQDPTDIARLKTTVYPTMIRCKVDGAMRPCDWMAKSCLMCLNDSEDFYMQMLWGRDRSWWQISWGCPMPQKVAWSSDKDWLASRAVGKTILHQRSTLCLREFPYDYAWITGTAWEFAK